MLAYYLRKEHLSLPHARQIMELATNLLQGREYQVTSDQVLDLVNISSCTAYDCEFIALAQDLKVPLVTVNRQILRNFPEQGISLEAFVRVK